MTLRVGSLCSGYGGLDLAVEAVFPDAELAWYAQYEPPNKKTGKPDQFQHAAKIMAHHWPGIPNLGDIALIDYAMVEPVDILTVGWPCQDMSLAGKQAGMMPGTRSGIWTHVAHAIGTLRPALVFLENVRSLTSAKAHCDLELHEGCVGAPRPGQPLLRALGCVLGDLADRGFDAEWQVLPASAVGAPHRRERCFVLAWPADAQSQGLQRRRFPALAARAAGQSGDSGVPAAEDPDGAAGGERRIAGSGQAQSGRARTDAGGRGGAEAAADAAGNGRGEGRPEPARLVGGPDAPERSGATAPREFDWDATEYGPAIRRWELIFGRPSPYPGNENKRLAPEFVEWMMGLPDGWVTAVPGVPRNPQLKALGNGVVPQQAEAALRTLLARYAEAVDEQHRSDDGEQGGRGTMSDTFGAWLLKQGERTDSIGSMARSWKQLKEERGYKHSQEKSVRELLSATFGEMWSQMQGDEVMNAAVAEWRGDFDKPAASGAAIQGTIFDLPAAAQDYLGDGLPEVPPVQRVGGPVILVINGADVELPPGRYTLAIVVQPTEIDAQQFADAVADAVAASYPPDWDALFRSADFTAPEE